MTVEEETQRAADEVKWQAERAAYEAARAARQVLREQMVAIAGPASGVRHDKLTPAQRDALLSLLLLKVGAVAEDGTVKPFEEWV